MATASWPVGAACRCWVVAWSMVVLLKKRVQLRATVSTSGVLADEKRRVAAPRFAEARNPPTGESAASGGASKGDHVRHDRTEESGRHHEEDRVQL